MLERCDKRGDVRNEYVEPSSTRFVSCVSRLCGIFHNLLHVSDRVVGSFGQEKIRLA